MYSKLVLDETIFKVVHTSKTVLKLENWLTHLWIPLVTKWVSSYSALWAPAQARAQAQKVSTGLTRVYRVLYSAVLDFPKLNHSF